jgi:hypothetical protein
MINLEIALVTIAAKPLTTTAKVLMLPDYSLPRSFIDAYHTCLDEATYLLKKYTNIDGIKNGVGWVPLTQKSIFDDISRTEESCRCITIPYLALLPEPVKLQEGAIWVRLEYLQNNKSEIYKDHFGIIHKVLIGG